MTSDVPATLAIFHTNNNLNYPLLHDVEAKHAKAFGVLNDQYPPGHGAYGVPHPGVMLLDGDGVVRFKLAEPGFRNRPSFEQIYAALEEGFNSSGEEQ